MPETHKGKKNICISGALKHLKTGDLFTIETSKNVCQSFAVLGADIVHKDHLSIVHTKDLRALGTLTLSSNYPFGRKGGDTPLRYVVYAELIN